MSPVITLAGQAYQQIRAFETRVGESCRWLLVRREEEGLPCLVQLWRPRPPERDLHHFKDLYLQRLIEGDPLDPPEGRFGFDNDQVWFLQELPGLSLARFWTDASPEARKSAASALRSALSRSPHPRFLHPEVVHMEPGRWRIPRVFGDTPTTLMDLQASLEELGEGSGEVATCPWEEAPELPERPPSPIRGRSSELTYLKSLMLGLGAPTPMERVMVLQGEEGMGHDRLSDWAAAVAETEGLWVHRLEVREGEGGGPFLARLLQTLLQGFEAELYARSPDTARTLSNRLPTFAFLRGSRQAETEGAEPGPVELRAALQVLPFAEEIHRRLVQIRGLERASDSLQKLLRDLVRDPALPWFFTVAGQGQTGPARLLLGALKGDPAVAFMNLPRLEETAVAQVLDDALGAHVLPGTFLEQAKAASLGNPGLLLRILELSRLDGDLTWAAGRWAARPGASPSTQLESDRMTRILEGRLHRLGPVSTALLRILALADQPLEAALLGSALGIAGDPLEDTLRSILQARLILMEEGRVAPADSRIRETVRAGIPAGEARRLARSLLKALESQGFSPLLSVRLQSLAHDPKHALAQVLQQADQAPPPPLEAQAMIQQALELKPSPAQQARLWEYLADAWAQGLSDRRLPDALPAGASAWSQALDALALARTALDAVGTGEESMEVVDQRARLLRKMAFLALKLRDRGSAARYIQEAAGGLTEAPLHLEQARLRLALGLMHRQEGHLNKAARAFEEGLQLVGLAPRAVQGDQVAFLVELGRIHGQRGQFQRALSTLQAAQRLLEHGQDFRPLVGVLDALAQILLVQGQPEAAYGCLREALQAAQVLEDLELQAMIHYSTGLFRSCEQSLGPALMHLEVALERHLRIGDQASATRDRVWKARTLAALGDAVQAENQLLQALGSPGEGLSAEERGDLAFLQGEIAQFRGSWGDAARLYAAAGDLFESSGLLWRERLARLRFIQVEAAGALQNPKAEPPEAAWTLLEAMKTVAEGSGSRWLELEWHRGHALLLSGMPTDSETMVGQTLTAWGEVLACSRDLGFRASSLEAAARSAMTLLRQGERYGARTRLQDAQAAFQELWSRVPEAYGTTFLERPDLHVFREALELAGLPFHLPERSDPLADWTPTQIPLPRVGLARGPR